MNTFTLYTRIPKNEFRQTIETDNLNRYVAYLGLILILMS